MTEIPWEHVPYLQSASVVMIHEETRYQVYLYVPLPLSLPLEWWIMLVLASPASVRQGQWYDVAGDECVWCSDRSSAHVKLIFTCSVQFNQFRYAMSVIEAHQDSGPRQRQRVIPIADWTCGCAGKSSEIPWEHVPYLSASEVMIHESRRHAISSVPVRTFTVTFYL